MGFVDNLEFYLDSHSKIIHVPSPSRLGYGDLGVHHQRIQIIPALLNQSK
jgi:uncharacterized protein (DUF1499 family)